MNTEIVSEHRPRKTSTRFALAICITTLVILVAGCSSKQAMIVPDLSMAPTLAKGERVYANFRTYRIEDPQVGDLAIFLPRDLQNLTWTLRVAAVAGDTVSFENNVLQINGSTRFAPAPRQSQTYRLPAEAHENASRALPYTLRENEYYFLSDDPEHAVDSRYWGPIHRSEIVGKLTL